MISNLDESPSCAQINRSIFDPCSWSPLATGLRLANGMVRLCVCATLMMAFGETFVGAHTGGPEIAADVQVPLSVHIKLQDDHSSQHSKLTLTIQVDVHGRGDAIGELQVSLCAGGIAHVLSNNHWTLTGAAAAHPQPIIAKIAISGLGEGSVRASVTELDVSGKTRWGSADEVFALQTTEGLLTGNSSGLELWRELLKREFESGKLSRQEYDKQTHRLLEQGKLDLSR